MGLGGCWDAKAAAILFSATFLLGLPAVVVASALSSIFRVIAVTRTSGSVPKSKKSKGCPAPPNAPSEDGPAGADGGGPGPGLSGEAASGRSVLRIQADTSAADASPRPWTMSSERPSSSTSRKPGLRARAPEDTSSLFSLFSLSESPFSLSQGIATPHSGPRERRRRLDGSA